MIDIARHIPNVLVNNRLHNRGTNDIRFKKPVIECLHPQFIVNPSLAELISKFGTYHFNGADYYEKHRFSRLYSFDKRPFQQLLDSLTSENYLDHYVVDCDSGEYYPIYLCVPCGHCELCREKKVNSFVNRIKYESFCYPYQPFFFTLTYNDKSLPEEGVSVRDCQLFLKRFRQRLVRSGFTERIRYVLVSEYGTKATHRPHYHGIFFGLPIRTDADCRLFEQLLGKAWSNGYVMARTVDMRDTATAYYTAKYMRKFRQPPKNCRAVFQLSSRRNGGIGSTFLAKQAKLLYKRVKCEVNVLNTWTGKTEPLRWSKYVLDKIFPSLSKSVPLELRKALKQYLLSYSFWKYYEPNLLWLFQTNYEKIKHKFRDLVYLPFDTLSLRELPLVDKDIAMSSIYENERVILKYFDRDFSQCHNKAKNRDFLLSNISLNRLDIDLVLKVSKIKRNIKRLEKLEVL